jgi:uncharacterized protein (DUF488 family)
MTPVLYTIGHSRHSIEKVLDLLRGHDVSTVVDVRSQPVSRFSPQFNRRALERSLAHAGVRYRFEGDNLGGRPSGQDFYDSDGRVRYDALAASEQFRRGIDDLISLAGSTGGAAIMCAEEDPKSCHRRLLIGRVLRERGIEVLHIRGDGRVEPQSLPPMPRQAVLIEGDSEAIPWRSARPARPRGKGGTGGAA